jgi:hypothetical protein
MQEIPVISCLIQGLLWCGLLFKTKEFVPPLCGCGTWCPALGEKLEFLERENVNVGDIK